MEQIKLTKKIDEFCLKWKREINEKACANLLDELDFEPDNALYEEISSFLTRTKVVACNDGRVDYDELTDVVKQLYELEDSVGALRGKRLTSEQVNTLLREIEAQLESATRTMNFINYLGDMGAISL